MANSKRKLEDMSVDEFMSCGLDTDSSSLSESSAGKKQKGKLSKKMKSTNQNSSTTKHKAKANKETPKPTKKKESSKLKMSLTKLKDQDPEFYEFLQKEDKSLLEFQESDIDDQSDDDLGDVMSASDDEASLDDSSNLEADLLGQSSGDSEDDDDEEDDKVGGRIHKLPKKLQVADDEDDSEDDSGSDAEEEESKPKKKAKLVTLKMVAHWTEVLEDKPSPQVFREAVSAFKAAVHQASESKAVITYQVVGSEVFNAVVKMCLAQMAPVVQTLLRLPPLVQVLQAPTMKNKKWKMMRIDVKSYLTDLLQLLSALSEPAMLNVILKHMHKLVVLYAGFPKLVKVFLKKMITMWSTGEETTRVLAFLCINKVARIQPDMILEPCMKLMYMAYVKNCKFTSPTTLPLINFMQRSMVEVFLMDLVVTYQYAFVYIRQLAIHLRNAITVKKRDTCQAVTNWQYIHCLGLWTTLLSTSYPSDVLQPLVYPLTQTIIGIVKLLPTARYFPLRFHCVHFLNQLSSSTETFIPVLPFLLEVFELTDFNKRHSSVGFKPFNFACILKFSKTQITEKGFKDGLVDQLYELLLENFNVHAHSIGFPELALPAVLQLKEFLKKCKIANYSKQIKQIIDKVSENSKFIVQRRKTASMNLSDSKAVDSWERQCKDEGTPLTRYYTTWRKLRDRELQHEIAGKERIVGSDSLPTIIRQKAPIRATKEEKQEFSSLFEQDSDDSNDDEIRFLPKQERARKRKNSESSNEYSDFDNDDWEKLGRSASEDDDDDDDDDDDVESSDETAHKIVTKPKPRRMDNSGDKDDVVEDFVMSSDSD